MKFKVGDHIERSDEFKQCGIIAIITGIDTKFDSYYVECNEKIAEHTSEYIDDRFRLNKKKLSNDFLKELLK
jgi:hypothetical protein